MVSRWEWIFKKQKETKPRNFIYIFNILFSYLHFVPPLHFHFHLKLKKKKKKSATSSKQKCGVYFRHVFGFKIHAEDLCLIR